MISEIRFYLMILLRRLPLVILIVALTTGGAVLYALSLPRSYTSSARLLVEAPQVTEGLSSSTVSTTPMAMMGMVQQKIMTRENLVAMAQRFGIPIADQSAEEIARKVENSLSMRNVSAPGEDTGVVTTITATADTAEGSAARVDDLIDQIVARSAEQRNTVASGTLEFIEAEVARLAQDLDARKDTLTNFTVEHENALPGNLGFYRTRQATLQAELKAAQTTLETLDDSARQIRMIAMASGEDDGLQAQLDEVRSELVEARLVYSATSPQVTRLAAREERLEQQIRAATEAAPQAETALPDTTGNMMADIQLADLAQKRQVLEGQIPALERQIAEVGTSIETIPANATALAALERNVEAAQIRYDDAMDRLLQAQNGARLETSDQAQRVTILEAPVVPQWPSAPNRKKIVALGTAAGIGIAGALLVVLELLGGRVRRSADLVRGLNITPLVTVPLLPIKKRG